MTTAGLKLSSMTDEELSRNVPLTITRTFLVHDGENTKVKVKLTIPGPDEECPLTLNPMKNDELSFVPGVTFSKTYVNHKKITLPCNHSFGAMTLLYHFSRNKMECPLCRAGKAYRLDSRSIPTHCRRQILNRIRELDQEVSREESVQNEAAARAIFTQFVRDLDIYLTQVYMTVYMCLGTEQISVFRLKMIFMIRAVIANDDNTEEDTLHFGLLIEQRRTLINHLHDLGIQDISLGFCLRDGGGVEPREISRSDPFPVAWNQGERRSVNCTIGTLSATSLAQGPNQFQSVNWSILAQELLNA